MLTLQQAYEVKQSIIEFLKAIFSLKKLNTNMAAKTAMEFGYSSNKIKDFQCEGPIN